MFSLGRPANEWNEIARLDTKLLNVIRRTFYQNLVCALVGTTTSSEFKVLAAISARTLRFKKLAEAISLEDFRLGLRKDGQQMLDDNDQPYFAGCNIAKDETIRKALVGLVNKQLITRWNAQRSGWANVYMPFDEDRLAELVVTEKGVLPASYGRIVRGEFLKLLPKGNIVQVLKWGDHNRQVTNLGNGLHAIGQPFEIPLAKAGCNPFRRLSVEELLDARSENRSYG